MTTRDEFDKYLDKRLSAAGALTPGQKLEVLATLRQEAQAGRFPFGGSVASVSVDNPAVQAVLRGEEVSLGAITVKAGEASGLVGRVATLPTWTRIGIVVAIPLLLLLGGGITALGKEPTPTPTPTPTLEATPTVDTVEMTPPPTDVPPPPPTEQPSPTPAFLKGNGKPAEDSREPASVEVAGRLFIVAKGEVQEDGTWMPQGPEWLYETEVRRVFSIPFENLADANVKAGDEIYVRTRGGQVLTYVVRDVVTLLANQIEIFKSLRPSVVIALPKQQGDVNAVERAVIFGEVKVDESEISVQEENAPPFAYVLASGANLREAPGFGGRIITTLPAWTPIYNTSTPPVLLDNQIWCYVYTTSSGYGWVSQLMLAIQ